MSLRKTLIAATLPLLAACSTGTEPTGTSVSLSFTTRAPSGPAFSIQHGADTLTDAQNQLVITSAQVVMREIELERVDVADCDVEPEPEGCDDFEIGPVLVDLPLNGATEREVTISIAPGTYDEMEFEVHKVNGGDEEDAAFVAANPNFDGISIRVTGEFNGNPFVFTSDLEAEQEFNLNPPLVIDEGVSSTNVTVRVGLDQWFRDAGGNLIDPATGNKGEVNESMIKENIKNSIDAFEDEDEDGDDLH